jgi:hypothetical protein
MNEDTSMISKMGLVEVIHIELPNKRGKSVVPEVFRKDDFL